MALLGSSPAQNSDIGSKEASSPPIRLHPRRSSPVLSRTPLQRIYHVSSTVANSRSFLAHRPASPGNSSRRLRPPEVAPCCCTGMALAVAPCVLLLLRQWSRTGQRSLR